MDLLSELKKYSYRVIKPHPLITGNSAWTEEHLKNNWGSISTHIHADGTREPVFSGTWFLKKEYGEPDEEGYADSWYAFYGEDHRIPCDIVENNPEYFEQIDAKALEKIRDRQEKELRRQQYLELKKEFAEE